MAEEGCWCLIILLAAVVAAGRVIAVRSILILGIILIADCVCHEEKVPVDGHQSTAGWQGDEAKEHEGSDQTSSIRAVLVETHNDMAALKLFFSELQ